MILWYAVMVDAEDTDWGTGSYDLTEAKQKAEAYGADAYIAVIEEGIDPTCVREIHQHGGEWDE